MLQKSKYNILVNQCHTNKNNYTIVEIIIIAIATITILILLIQ